MISFAKQLTAVKIEGSAILTVPTSKTDVGSRIVPVATQNITLQEHAEQNKTTEISQTVQRVK